VGVFVAYRRHLVLASFLAPSSKWMLTFAVTYVLAGVHRALSQTVDTAVAALSPRPEIRFHANSEDAINVARLLQIVQPSDSRSWTPKGRAMGSEPLHSRVPYNLYHWVYRLRSAHFSQRIHNTLRVAENTEMQLKRIRVVALQVASNGTVSYLARRVPI